MRDDLDDRIAGMALSPPPDFAARMVALAAATPQPAKPPPALGPLQWLSLAAGAGVGAWLLGEFVAVAFVASAAL
jgi:hypothetical protein